MVSNHDSDADLVRRAIAGDARAFGTLYEKRMTAIYRHSDYRLGDSAEAEDLTETTFLRVWDGLKRFQPGRVAFRSWLYRVPTTC